VNIVVKALAIALASATVLTLPSPVAKASDYPKNLFAVAQMRIDATREPHGLNWYLKSREAQGIIQTVAAYMGIDTTYVKLALDSIPKVVRVEEETHFGLPVPSGYAFCAARIGMRSMVPGTGERAAFISANATATSVDIYTWTPVRHLGEGRSWVEADVQVTGIKPEYLEEFRNKGVCKPPAPQILKCRGNCPGVEWGRIQDAGATTSDLTQGF
jgi:hypothetical protein